MSDTMQLLDINNLMYSQSIDISSGIDRKIIERFPEKTNYKNTEDIVFTLKNTRQFIDFKNSSLSFEFKTDGGTAVVFNSTGSFLNLIRRVIVRAPDGSVLSHCDKVNLLQRNLLKVKHGKNYADVIAPSFGYGSLNDLQVGNKFITIPMRFISPIFDNDKIMPPQLVDTLRIEIQLEKIAIAFNSGTAPTSYSIIDPVLHLDSYQMLPAILSEILDREELIYEYHDWNNTVAGLSDAGDDFYFQYDRSVSNALEAFVVLRNTDVFADDADSFEQKSIGVNNVNDRLVWRWGSLLLPHQAINRSSNLYQNVLYCYGQLDKKNALDFNLSLNEFELEVGETSSAIYPVNLRRSKLFNNSGREISNRNNLACEIRTSVAGSYQADMFTMSLSRVLIRGDEFIVEE
jgi:hypothetical protein